MAVPVKSRLPQSRAYPVDSGSLHPDPHYLGKTNRLQGSEDLEPRARMDPLFAIEVSAEKGHASDLLLQRFQLLTGDALYFLLLLAGSEKAPLLVIRCVYPYICL